MPPWLGRDGNRPGSPGGAIRAAASRPYEKKRWRDAMTVGLIWRGMGTPPYGPGRTCAAGATSRPYEGKAGFYPDRPDRLWVQGSPLLAGGAVGAKTAPRQRAMEDGCVCGARFCVLYGLPPQMGQGS